MTLLARPDTIFEANFFNSTDGQAWTDLSSYVELQEGISISKRRQVIFNDVSAGSFSISLDNSDGTFNNDRSDLDFFGLIGIDVPVRFRARWPNVPTGTVNMLTDDQSITDSTDVFGAEQGSLDVDTAWSYVNQGTPADTSYIILTQADGDNTYEGQQFTIDTGAAAGTTVYTITAVDAPFAGFRNIHITPNMPALPAASDTVTATVTPLIWQTDVLQTTGIHVLTGHFPSRSADNYPMYVSPSTSYSGGIQVRTDTNGTGISFAVKARIAWYDKKGAFISESSGSSVTLTTAYQAVTVTATSPATAYTARLSITNETTVGPASAAIANTGRTSDRVNRGGRFTHLTVPVEASAGDLALVWNYVNSQPIFTNPAGWTVLDTWTDSRGKAQLVYKILTQDDIDTVTEWTIDQRGKHWLAMMSTYSGIDQTTPINQHNTSAETTFGTGHVTPSVTTTVANCWIVNAVFDTSSTNHTWTAPVGFTERTTAYCSGGNAATGIVADNATEVVAGTYGGNSYTSSASSKFASMSTVAIAPAAGTGPGTVGVYMGGWQFVAGSSLSTWVKGGHWKDLFTGLTDSWTKSWAGDLSIMQVAATDRSKTLQANNVGPAVYETILSTNPVAYYMLNESGDVSTTEAANSAITPQAPLTLLQIGTGGTLEWGNGVGPPVDGQAAVVITKVDRNNGPALRTNLTNPVVGATEVTLMAWFASTDATAAYGTVAKAVNVGYGTTEFAYVELRGYPGTNFEANSFVKSEIASNNAIAQDFTSYFTGATHFACGVFQLTGGNLVSTLYIDGVQTATSSTATAFTEFPPLVVMEVGNAYPSTAVLSGTYSHVALVDSALTADTIAEIYTAGSTAFAGDLVHERIGRLADWAGISDLALDTSDSICDRHMPDTQTILDAIHQAARTDGGTSFVDDSGNIAFKSRAGKATAITPWLTVDARLVDPSLNEVTDDQLLVNQATIKRLGANTTTVVTNTVSQTAHGIYNKDVETIMKDANEAQYNGEYLVTFYSTPTERCDSVTIQALFLNDWATLLTQDMWNIIELTNLPSIEQSTTKSLYIEGWAHQIDDSRWDITYDTSATISFAVLNDSSRGLPGSVIVAW